MMLWPQVALIYCGLDAGTLGYMALSGMPELKGSGSMTSRAPGELFESLKPAARQSVYNFYLVSVTLVTTSYYRL